MKTFSLALLCLISFTAQADKAPARTGAQVFQTYCTNCHAGGWQGAPVANDKAEWADRLANGFESLLKNTKRGLNAMPPMGTCMDCTDAELKASIEEMLQF